MINCKQSYREPLQTCEKGTLAAMNAVLPWPCIHLCMTHQEPGLGVSHAQAVQATTVSLRLFLQRERNEHLSTECLLA